MSDTPPPPVVPPPHADKASDTASGASEGTGPQPAPGAAEQGTVPSDHPHRPHPAAVGGADRFAGYRVLQKIGEGGMGAVYLAEDTKLGRKVAIKTMRPDLAANRLDRDRFLREAGAAATVEHDNLVPIFHIGEAADGTPFIVMPFLKGETLDARLKRQAAADPELVLKVACEVADGLAAAHAAGLVHRDIKPANVWLESDPAAAEAAQRVRRCKILDFGLARSADKGDVQLTASGVVLGTPAYMAPEQARGEKVDHRTDLFSLGVTLYRAATGRPPFDGTTPMAVLIALTTDTPTAVRALAPNLPAELAELIGRLMCKDPAGRPQSAAEVAAAARRIADEWRAKSASRTVPVPAAPLAPAPAEAEPLSLPAAPPAAVSSSAPQVLPDPLEALAATAESTPPPAPKRPATGAKRVRLSWLIAAAVCLLVLAPAAWWLATRDRGATTDPTPGPTAAPKADPKDGPPARDADRAAAEYVLSFPGSSVGVLVGEAERDVTAAAELPKEPFRVVRVRFAENSPVTDAGLAVFKDCRDVLAFNLKDTPVGDDGVAHFAGCKGLKYLYLHNTKVGGRGLAALKDCTGLVDLYLGSTQVTGADLVHIKRFTKLGTLRLDGLKLSAEAVNDLAKTLPGCKIVWDGGAIEPKEKPNPDRAAALWVLSTPNAEGTVSVRVNGERKDIKAAKDLPKEPFELTAVSLIPRLVDMKLVVPRDADLAVFKDCKNVTSLYLVGTEITNAGLAHFGNCKALEDLNLSGTKVNDQAAAVIKQFTKLTDLSLGATDFQEKGVREIAAALPGCRIQFGYTIEPATEADRKAAEYALSIDGKVRVNYEERDIKDAKGLPKEPFRLTGINLRENKNVSDAGLAAFAGCKNLTAIDLSGTQAGDTGMANFKECKNLKVLDLYDTKVGDAGLAHFKECQQLEELALARTPVSDVGLANFKGCTGMKELYLYGTQVSDASLELIKQFKTLTVLELRRAKITEKGVKELAKALPGCRIQHDSGTIEPKKP